MARESHATITGLYVTGLVRPRTKDPISPLEKIFVEPFSKNYEKSKNKGSKT